MEDKNYYDWLEVSPKASPEVIEKAYKSLAKKYHPDLQKGNPQESEELMKKINEAYEVLSDEEKRLKYDTELEQQKKLHAVEYSNTNAKKISNIQTNTLTYKSPQVQAPIKKIDNLRQIAQEKEKQRQIKLAQFEYQRQLEMAKRQAYHDAYIQDMKRRGYKIRYKKSFKDYVRMAKVILIFFIIIFILWSIPFVRNNIIKFINENESIQMIINIFTKNK